KAKKKIKERQQELRIWLEKIKSGLSCELCEESHQAGLDFHHEDPSLKDAELSVAIKCGWSKERMLEEIGKCKILCS
ncbi:hypothetical protein ABTM82_20300, partial [Acinetobacter baumannii]